MSLQDVFLFLAQDLGSKEPRKDRDPVIAMEMVPHRGYTARRLNISVTSDSCRPT
jgi:hypothetical protein